MAHALVGGHAVDPLVVLRYPEMLDEYVNIARG